MVSETIVENLNKIETPVLALKDKRCERDRWILLKSKYKRKINDEEPASGIDVDKLTEGDTFLVLNQVCE